MTVSVGSFLKYRVLQVCDADGSWLVASMGMDEMFFSDAGHSGGSLKHNHEKKNKIKKSQVNINGY